MRTSEGLYGVGLGRRVVVMISFVECELSGSFFAASASWNSGAGFLDVARRESRGEPGEGEDREATPFG